jgi:arginyl-tRNA--protein-N-Asp/Glu arginylyltransferase
MSYLSWKQVTRPNATEAEIETLYNDGFVATRLGRGVFDQTRSFRIALQNFSLSSENRRILKKTGGLSLEIFPLPYSQYTWEIGKLGKDFYDTKFGPGTMSANKIKEILTDTSASSFTHLFIYSFEGNVVGYCVALVTQNLVHYSYPFYALDTSLDSLGLGMMTRAIEWAQSVDKSHIYLGSLQRPTDTYKLQFEGGEWFDGTMWSTDTSSVKNILN